MAAHVDDHRTGEDQDRIFAIGDVYTVGVRPGEPLFGDLGYGLALTGHGVFVVREIASRYAALWDADGTGLRYPEVIADGFAEAGMAGRYRH